MFRVLSFYNNFRDWLRAYLDVDPEKFDSGLDEDGIYQARVINATFVAVSTITFLAIFVRFYQYETLPLSWYLVFAYCTLNLFLPWITRRFDHHWHFGLLSLSVGTVLLFLRILDTGGLSGVTISWVTLPPIVFALILGTKAMVFSVIMCSVYILFLVTFAEKLDLVRSLDHSLEKNSIIILLLVFLHGILTRIFVRQKRKTADELAKTLSSLKQTRKLASLGTMASGIAHQINNPLMILLSQTEIIRREIELLELQDERRELIQRCSKRLDQHILKIQSVVNALLVIGKSHPKETFRFIALSPIISEAIEYVHQRFPSRKTVFKLPPDDLIVHGQNVLLVQLLLNLLTNAHEAVENDAQGWVRLDYSIFEDKIQIRVSNSGLKIDPKIRDGLFSPFFTTKPLSRGNGLGLVLSRTIAEIHDGHLDYNDEEKFTTFELTLPLEEKR